MRTIARHLSRRFLPHASALAAVLAMLPALSASAESYVVSVSGIPGGDFFNLVGNNLDHPPNDLATLFDQTTAPGMPVDTAIVQWNAVVQAFEPWAYWTGSAWVDGLGHEVGALRTVRPGQGFWFVNPGAPFEVTFTGDPITPVPVNMPCYTADLRASQTYPGGSAYEVMGGATMCPGAVMYAWDEVAYVTISLYHPMAGWSPITLGAGQAVVVANPSPPTDPTHPTVITNQPQSQVVTEGATAVFTVGATGYAPYTYRWYHQDAEMAGETNATLVISGAQAADEGSYRVVVVNTYLYPAASDPAELTVLPDTSCSEPPPGMVGWWPANGNAWDHAGRQHGVVLGEAVFTTGKYCQAFQADGIDDAIETTPATMSRSAFSGMLWIRIDPLGDAAYRGCWSQFPPYPENLFSTFEDGSLEGWTTHAPFGATLELIPRDAGFCLTACAVELGEQELRARAPANWSGDLSRYTGIDYDEWLPDDATRNTVVIIEGANGTTLRSVAEPLRPTLAWSRVYVPFEPVAWIVDGSNSFESVLADVDHIGIDLGVSPNLTSCMEARIDSVGLGVPVIDIPNLVFYAGEIEGLPAFGLRGYWDDGTPIDLLTPVGLETGVWTHLAFTYDGAFLRQYLDGALDNEQAVPGKTLLFGGPLYLGRTTSHTNDAFNSSYVFDTYFHGLLDEAALFDRALEPEEIEGLADQEGAGMCQPIRLGLEYDPPSMVLRWATCPAGYALQAAEVLSPTAWGDVTNVPQVNGYWNRVTLEAALSNRYYRLHD